MTSLADINSTLHLPFHTNMGDDIAQTPKEVVTEFCSETTAHGPGHIAHETHRAMKVVWLTVFLGALCGLGYHLSVTIGRYLDRPTQQLMYVAPDPPSFPHVSVCNLNPMSETNLQGLFATHPGSNTSWFQGVVERLSPQFGEVSSSIGHIDDLFGTAVSYYENIGEAEAAAIGFKFNDFVLDCTYAQASCSEEDFDVFFHPMYYNCFTFTGRNIKKTHPKTGTGPYHGLTLVLYLGQGASSLQTFYNRYSPIGNSVGARIEIHEAEHGPQPDIHGVDVQPGVSTSMALRSELTVRESPPFGNCTTGTIPATSLHPPLNYSSALCKALCEQDYVYAACGCYVPSLPFPGQPTCGSYHVPGSSDAVKLQNYLRNMECRVAAEGRFKQDKAAQDKCDCQPECETTRYFSSLSGSQWPGPEFQQNFLNEYLGERSDKESLEAYQHLNGYMTGSVDKAALDDIVSTQFARVNIYFTDLEVVVHKTVPAYELTTMFCDVGGTLGLWAGVSIITMLELLAYAGKLAAVVCRSSSERSGKKVTVRPSPEPPTQQGYGEFKQ